MIKFLWGAKDGGPESKVWVWGLEIKSLFSVLLLKFELGSREAYHSHAFDAVSWVLRGGLEEQCLDEYHNNWYFPSWRPVFTKRETTHKVYGLLKATWVLSLRGPWKAKWTEFVDGRYSTLTYGRKELKND